MVIPGAAQVDIRLAKRIADEIASTHGVDVGGFRFSVQDGRVPQLEISWTVEERAVMTLPEKLARAVALPWGEISFRVRAGELTDRLRVERILHVRDATP